MSWPAELQGILSDYYRNRAKITNWTGVQAVQALEDGHEENMKNREAESAAVRRQLWGENSNSGGDPDEMRQTILGDITHPAPIIMPQQQQSPWPMTLLAAAVAGLGGYWLATKEQPQQQHEPTQVPAVAYQDETISVGLGRLEDYTEGQ